ncbi:sterile alpha motif (SAM) domain-containing protein [Actinidia rufa]|uniref:Sterile alpha motif (SAM) domain-containing protein n=1 Tax=Actinidia rufa TaxID=165716 RepID=A0A7J0FKZ0_9ERIC|nr:sterile alpha motif (SAM) domain-containing protein [Actinidia rufa]
MYADREDVSTRRSIKDRLNSNDDSGRRRPITGKRQRQEDDKWEHDLYKDGEPQVSNRRIGTKDLRMKLQKKSAQQTSQSGNGSVSVARDLREKLSGETYLRPLNTDPKPKPVLQGSKPVRKSVIVETPEPEIKKVASSVPKQNAQQKLEKFDVLLVDGVSLFKEYVLFGLLLPGGGRDMFCCTLCLIPAESVDSFLQSIGLEKYSITFQAEEVCAPWNITVDMTALVHMTDGDLKALGVPMFAAAVVPDTSITFIYLGMFLTHLNVLFQPGNIHE